MFLDLIGGIRYQDSQVKSQFQQTKATADYFIPYAGARLQDYQATYDYVAAVNVEGGITSTSSTVLAEMDARIPIPTSSFSSRTSRDLFILNRWLIRRILRPAAARWRMSCIFLSAVNGLWVTG